MSKFKKISKRIVLANNSKNEFDKLVKLTHLIDSDLQAHNKPWYVRVTNNSSEIRSMAQNALYAIYVNAINDEFGGDSLSTRRLMKRQFGLNILLSQSKDNTKAGHEAYAIVLLLNTINYRVQPYDVQETMLQPLPCTSIMTSKNFVKFLREIEVFYAEKGLVLKSINETKRCEAFS